MPRIVGAKALGAGAKDNPRMLRTTVLAAALGAWALAGCSPTFNWREVRAEPTPLKAMLPCKPDKGSRQVTMAGRPVELRVLGCDTGGATFAVMFADVGDASRSADVLAHWKLATLANLRAGSSRELAFRPPGAIALAPSAQVAATGRRSDGSAVESRAAYFARGRHVFQAVIYADTIRPEWAQTFFAGLQFE